MIFPVDWLPIVMSHAVSATDHFPWMENAIEKKKLQSNARCYLLAHCPVSSRRKLRNNGNWQPFHYPRQQQPPRDFQNSSRCQHVLRHHPVSPTSSRVRGLLSLPLLPSSLGYFCRWSFRKSKDSQDQKNKNKNKKSWSVRQRNASRLNVSRKADF